MFYCCRSQIKLKDQIIAKLLETSTLESPFISLSLSNYKMLLRFIYRNNARDLQRQCWRCAKVAGMQEFSIGNVHRIFGHVM
jgi:hypothetical protein